MPPEMKVLFLCYWVFLRRTPGKLGRKADIRCSMKQEQAPVAAKFQVPQGCLWQSPSAGAGLALLEQLLHYPAPQPQL